MSNYDDALEALNSGNTEVLLRKLLDSQRDAKQVATVTWDFAIDGGAVGSIDLTSKVKNMFPVGAVITDFSFTAARAITGAGEFDVNDGVTSTIYFGSDLATSFAHDGDRIAFNYGNNNNDALLAVASSAGTGSRVLPKVVFTIATAPLTAGKVVIQFEYYLPAI